MNLPAEPCSLWRELSSCSWAGPVANRNAHGSSASTSVTAASTAPPTVEAALTWSFQPSSGSSPGVGLAVHQKPSTSTCQRTRRSGRSRPSRPSRPLRPCCPSVRPSGPSTGRLPAARAARVIPGHRPSRSGPSPAEPSPVGSVPPAVRSDVSARIRHHIPSSGADAPAPVPTARAPGARPRPEIGSSEGPGAVARWRPAPPRPHPARSARLARRVHPACTGVYPGRRLRPVALPVPRSGRLPLPGQLPFAEVKLLSVASDAQSEAGHFTRKGDPGAVSNSCEPRGVRDDRPVTRPERSRAPVERGRRPPGDTRAAG